MATRHRHIVCVEHTPGSEVPLDSKLVLLVRHGQGTHNLFASQFQITCECRRGGSICVYQNKEHTDAQLTERGRMEAAAVGPKLLLQNPKPEVMFSSPLTRALQTSTIALAEATGLQIPLIASELLREQYGRHCCDMRATLNDLRERFPTVDFLNMHSNSDILHDPQVRETDEHVRDRAYQFFSSLKERNEKSIVVVAHGGFFYHSLNGMFVIPDSYVARRFKTAESRSVLLKYV